MDEECGALVDRGEICDASNATQTRPWIAQIVPVGGEKWRRKQSRSRSLSDCCYCRAVDKSE